MTGEAPSIEEWPQPGQDQPQVGQVSAVAVDSNGTQFFPLAFIRNSSQAICTFSIAAHVRGMRRASTTTTSFYRQSLLLSRRTWYTASAMNQLYRMRTGGRCRHWRCTGELRRQQILHATRSHHRCARQLLVYRCRHASGLAFVSSN